MKAEGRLIGGYLDTLRQLAGTPYGDVPGLHASSDDGCIVFLGTFVCGLSPCHGHSISSSMRAGSMASMGFCLDAQARLTRHRSLS